MLGVRPATVATNPGVRPGTPPNAGGIGSGGALLTQAGTEGRICLARGREDWECRGIRVLLEGEVVEEEGE